MPAKTETAVPVLMKAVRKRKGVRVILKHGLPDRYAGIFSCAAEAFEYGASRLKGTVLPLDKESKFC